MAYYPSVLPTLASPGSDPNGIGDASSKQSGGTPKPRNLSLYADELKNILYNIRGIAVGLGLPTGVGSAFDQIAAGFADNAVTNAKLRDSSATSVIGRDANSIGDPTDIIAGANDRLLARVADVLAFVQLTAGMIPDGLISNIKLRDSAATSVVGRAANSIGAPADIPAVANDRLLARVSDIVQFVQLTLGMIPDNLLTDVKLRQSAGTTVIGRSAGTTGNVADIAASADDRMLARVAGALSFVQMTIGMIPDGLLTRAKLANATALSVIGRSANSTGAPADIAATTNDRVLARTAAAALDWVQVTSAMLASSIVTPAKLAAWPAAAMYRSAGQSIGNASPTQILFDSSEFAYGGSDAPVVDVPNSRIQITRAGVYRISARVGLNTTAPTTAIAVATIRVNGVDAAESRIAAGASGSTVEVSVTRPLAATDLVTATTYHNNGGSLTTYTPAPARPRLSVEYVGPTV